MVAGDRLVYQVMGDLNQRAAKGTEGKYGYTMAGAVTGATYPSDIRALRKRLEHTFFLVPGYGAQGGLRRTYSMPLTSTATGPSSTPPGASCVRGRRPAGTAGILPRRPGCGHRHAGRHQALRHHRVTAPAKGRGWGKEEGLWQSGPVCSAERWREAGPCATSPLCGTSQTLCEKCMRRYRDAAGEEKIALRGVYGPVPHLREGEEVGSASPRPGSSGSGSWSRRGSAGSRRSSARPR